MSNQDKQDWWRAADDAWWQYDGALGELRGVPARAANALRRAGYDTAQKVRDAGPAKILALEEIGPKGLEQIKIWLRKLDDPKPRI